MHMIFSCHKSLLNHKQVQILHINRTKNLRFIQSLWILVANEASLLITNIDQKLNFDDQFK